MIDYGPVTHVYTADRPEFCHCRADSRPHSHRVNPRTRSSQIPRTIRFYPHELSELEATWAQAQMDAIQVGKKPPNWNQWVVSRLMETEMPPITDGTPAVVHPRKG